MQEGGSASVHGGHAEMRCGARVVPCLCALVSAEAALYEECSVVSEGLDWGERERL
jgi:hypothetical protein